MNVGGSGGISLQTSGAFAVSFREVRVGFLLLWVFRAAP